MNDGILLIDKPAGISSASVVYRIKKRFRFSKVGHAGTLDPFATGLMVITVGKATRLSRFFLDADKRYTARLGLGTLTDTLDPEGEVLTTETPEAMTALEARLELSRVEALCADFTGDFMQVPPVYSALKHNGVPLYKLARKGQAVEKPPRPVTLHENRLIAFSFPHIDFEVNCSKGTYIRSLARDMAEALGTVGHLTSLRRIESSGFHVEEALPLSDTETMDREELNLIPMADALSHLPAMVVDEKTRALVMNGNPLAWTPCGEEAGADFCRVLDTEGALIAMVEAAKCGSHHKYCCVFNA
ncbi:tRNA pseudouridine(55) synthase TruB [Desulfoluna spongiiphila]|uniref:tRNA pseudouridine synthase B n=1 Tax=Desulfoluna spongiiphila TaxID=419481 RepID=A0A1G5GN95_9BACT|nr:tRNA pseudouridine(55) synthase TruB [Desulfoluna spongiiphila]SCY53035.1 tRNA pseudouridine55 synthase [Desulfoluna spongiiphila]